MKPRKKSKNDIYIRCLVVHYVVIYVTLLRVDSVIKKNNTRYKESNV